MTDTKWTARLLKLRVALLTALIGFGTFGVLAGLGYLWLWGMLAAWHRYGFALTALIAVMPVLIALASRLTFILYKGAIARLVEKGKIAMKESE